MLILGASLASSFKEETSYSSLRLQRAKGKLTYVFAENDTAGQVG